MKCGKPIMQGLRPHYCEKCLKELGLEYDKDIQEIIKELKKKGQ
jgi:hypothetical protein